MITIKDWFLSKKLREMTEGEAYAVRLAVAGQELSIKKETEKAVLIRAASDFGAVTFWCPKSCIVA
ncbi:MAG: hypothetical protein LBR05_00990 [Azoarcus sp.]|jgi:hypothetical protein|nr:hypothetical protein [Azoarcus sp.]